MTPRNIRIRYTGILAISLVIAGCSGRGYPTTKLEGRVTVAGQPVEQGVITFTPLASNSGAGASAPISSGQYVVESVPLGMVRVHFTAFKKTGRTLLVFGQPTPETVGVIPEKYRAGIEIEVTDAGVRKDFDL